MPKFRVHLVETVTYTVVVEAEDADEAVTEATALWEDSEDPTKDFDGIGMGVEHEAVDIIEED